MNTELEKVIKFVTAHVKRVTSTDVAIIVTDEKPSSALQVEDGKYSYFVSEKDLSVLSGSIKDNIVSAISAYNQAQK
jgi:hypothetical protein